MKITSITLPILFIAVACSSDGSSVGLSVQAVSVDDTRASDSLIMVDDGNGDYQIESAILRLRDIELDLPDGANCQELEDNIGGGAECEPGTSGDKIVINGPFEIDLATGVSTPDLSSVEIPVGTYSRIDFRVDNVGDAPSLELVALFKHEGTDMTLDLSLDFNEDIRIESPQGVVIDGESNLVAQFVVNNWLGGVNIGDCMDNGNLSITGNHVLIDESTSGGCSDIENTIKDNMKNSTQISDH